MPRVTELLLPPAPPPPATLLDTVRQTAAVAIGADEPWCNHRERAIDEYVDGLSNTELVQLLSFALEEMRR